VSVGAVGSDEPKFELRCAACGYGVFVRMAPGQLSHVPRQRLGTRRTGRAPSGQPVVLEAERSWSATRTGQRPARGRVLVVDDDARGAE
jgi:hypothetical protein